LLTGPALRAMQPFGGGLIGNGTGGRIDIGGGIQRFIQAATQTTGYTGAGGLSAQRAKDVFTYGSQGRVNLQKLGLSEDQINMVAKWATAQSQNGGSLQWGNRQDMQRAGLVDPYSKSVMQRMERGTAGDTEMFAKSATSLEDVNDQLGKLNEA